MRHYLIILWGLLATMLEARGQEFFNLTAEQVRIDSVLPRFTHSFALGKDYADSLYEVKISYPEYLDMSPADVNRVKQLVSQPLSEQPDVETYIAIERKRASLYVNFVPIVFRGGRYQKLVSFKLELKSEGVAKARSNAPADLSSPSSRYASHSVLATGQWAKIRVPSTGVYQLSDALIRQAGFSRPERVKVYGYGGALQPEALTGDYLAKTDDLKEVPTCTVGGRRLFYAVGPVSWASDITSVRTRNYCSDYGYYFLTESDADPLTQDSAAFVSSFYPVADDYHSLAEQDGYAWYHGGRNLYDGTPLSSSQTTVYKLDAHQSNATLTVAMSYNAAFTASVTVNDSVVGKLEVTQSQAASDFNEYKYATAGVRSWNFRLTNLKQGTNSIGLKQTSGTDELRTDNLTLVFTEPRPAPSLSSDVLPVPEYVYRITNQDHHGDSIVDMVIIIPTSQKLLAQAERLKTLHEQHDSMTVRIVPADELFNEFSSGTPDPNAYRRYMKMLYDRAETDGRQPSHLLLMGDGAWDNRMVSSQWRSFSPDDFLLCFESENSFSHTYCFVSDDYYTLLDDGELLTNYRGKPDIAVGRISARTDAEAKIAVDKIIGYVQNEYAGSWQNTICIMADDGNNNQHMADAETMASVVTKADSAFLIKKVYWDAYNRVASSTGNSYPEVERLLRQQMQEGALIMNYSGHGAAYCLSHEQVLKLADIKAASSGGKLPLWVTASCDIAPFDGQEENLGEAALFNANGGAIAFLGTTRTVFMSENRQLNRAFMSHVFESVSGQRVSIGEALRLAKNDLVDTGSDVSANKLHYVLLGDPAVVLASPTARIVIDSIAGQSAVGADVHLAAGAKVSVVGHVAGQSSFSGIVQAMVLDVEETIVCKLNEPSGSSSEKNYQFITRPNIIYTGNDSIRQGRFVFTFAVPKDVSYSSASGQLLIYALNNSSTKSAHGQYTGFVLDGDSLYADDGVGPSIYCYLNSEAFQNGGTVNSTPYFYAELSDKDGINAAGGGIGHDLELIIDGEMQQTYNLNSSFSYDFGNYQRGTVGYSIPQLADGPHRLLFRAWDVLNNSSVAELTFVVDSKQQPSILSVACTKNPAVNNTRFLIRHDRAGSELDVTLQIFDPSGRMLWQRSETGLSSGQTYAIDWDLTLSGGFSLSTGVYLYRVLVASNGSTEATAARKLIVIKQ